jgi:hypothetical protein
MAIHKDKNCDGKYVAYDLRAYNPSWQEIYKQDEESKRQLNNMIQEAVEIHMKTYNDQDNKPR